MKQKVVIKVSMNDQRSRTKALKIAASLPGIESTAIVGKEKEQLEVKGDGVDVVDLTTLLRRSIGFAEIVSVDPVEEKKEEKKEEPKPAAAAYSHPVVVPPYWGYYSGVPAYPNHYYQSQYQQQDSCSIM